MPDPCKDAVLTFIGNANAKCDTLPSEIRLWDVKQGSDFVVGRSGDVVIHSGKLPLFVSNRHARFCFRNNCWKIRDLQSSNGLYINKKKIEKNRDHSGFDYVTLKDGDKISFGPPIDTQGKAIGEGIGGFLFAFNMLPRQRPLPSASAENGQGPARVACSESREEMTSRMSAEKHAGTAESVVNRAPVDVSHVGSSTSAVTAGQSDLTLSPIGKRKRVELPHTHSQVLDWFAATLDEGSYKITKEDRAKFLHNVERESIDYHTVLTLTESDLQDLGLNLGNRRKMLNHIKDTFSTLETPTQARVQCFPEYEPGQTTRVKLASQCEVVGEGKPLALQEEQPSQEDESESDDEDDDSPILGMDPARGSGSTSDVLTPPPKETGTAHEIPGATSHVARTRAGESAASHPSSRDEEAAASCETGTQQCMVSVHAELPVAEERDAPSVVADKQVSSSNIDEDTPLRIREKEGGAAVRKEGERGCKASGQDTAAANLNGGDEPNKVDSVTGETPRSKENGVDADEEKESQRKRAKRHGIQTVALKAGKEVQDSACWWSVGKHVELLFEQEWWQAKVLRTKRESDCEFSILVGYVGGTADENEWVKIGDGRVRPPSPSWAEDARRPIPTKRGGLDECASKRRNAQFQVGDRVRGRYQPNGSWYDAEIVDRDGDKWVIRWEDGDAKDRVKVSKDLRHLCRDARFQVGDTVQAQYRSYRGWYKAEIIDWDGKRFTLRWADGSVCDVLKTESQLRPPRCPKSVAQAANPTENKRQRPQTKAADKAVPGKTEHSFAPQPTAESTEHEDAVAQAGGVGALESGGEQHHTWGQSSESLEY